MFILSYKWRQTWRREMMRRTWPTWERVRTSEATTSLSTMLSWITRIRNRLTSQHRLLIDMKKTSLPMTGISESVKDNWDNKGLSHVVCNRWTAILKDGSSWNTKIARRTSSLIACVVNTNSDRKETEVSRTTPSTWSMNRRHKAKWWSNKRWCEARGLSIEEAILSNQVTLFSIQ